MFLIISTLFLIHGVASTDNGWIKIWDSSNSSKIMPRSNAIGFDYCYPNQPLRMRCSKDCESIEYCMNGRIMSLNCDQQYGLKYCDMSEGRPKCSDDLEICYNSVDNCPRDGLYPDLLHCDRYVYCEGEAMQPYKCEYGTKWNYKTKRCDYDAECRTFSRSTGCSKYTAIVAHQNPFWFVFCYYGLPVLAECPGSTYTFDEEIGDCRFQCQHLENVCNNSKYPDEFNNTIYYDCHKVRPGKWETIKKTCPEGTVFNAELEVCSRNIWDGLPVYFDYPTPRPDIRNLTTNQTTASKITASAGTPITTKIMTSTIETTAVTSRKSTGTTITTVSRSLADTTTGTSERTVEATTATTMMSQTTSTD